MHSSHNSYRSCGFAVRYGVGALGSVSERVDSRVASEPLWHVQQPLVLFAMLARVQPEVMLCSAPFCQTGSVDLFVEN